MDGDTLTMADIYNERGGYLTRKAAELEVDVDGLAAVLSVESTNSGFTKNGDNMRHNVRLEARVLAGRTDSPLFLQHFEPGASSSDNKFSVEAGGTKVSYHGDQDTEWQALNVAQAFADKAAIESASHGIGQVMGFNHELVGYNTPEEMFVAFSDSLEKQLDGFIEFIKGRSACMAGLRARDWEAFAGCYNGAGNEVEYGRRIERSVAAYAAVIVGKTAITEVADGETCTGQEGDTGTCKKVENCNGWASTSSTCGGGTKCCVRTDQAASCGNDTGTSPATVAMFIMAGVVPIGGYGFYKHQQGQKKRVEAEAKFLEGRSKAGKTGGANARPVTESVSDVEGTPHPDSAREAPADPPPPYAAATKETTFQSATSSDSNVSNGSKGSSKGSKGKRRTPSGSKNVKRHGSKSSRGSRSKTRSNK